MSDVRPFAASVLEGAMAVRPHVESDLRFAAEGARESADLWLWGEGVPEFCISITDAFPKVGVLVDEYVFDQIPRDAVRKLLNAILTDRASVRIGRGFGMSTVILSVTIEPLAWEATRDYRGNLEPWEQRILVT